MKNNNITILTTKESIAKAINFGQYPVLTIDLANQIIMCNEVVGCTGCKVKIPYTSYDGRNIELRAELKYFKDSGLIISNSGCCISSGLSGSEVLEMAEYANAPTLRKDQAFVLVVYNSKTNETCYPMILHTADYIRAFSSEPLHIVESVQFEIKKGNK